MKRLVMMVSGIALISAILTANAVAAEGNALKGKYTYRKIYQSCQARGAVESPKPILNPDIKTQAQWKRVFEKKDFTEFGCADEWQKLTDEELTNIYTYLYEHAADSPTPAKCK